MNMIPQSLPQMSEEQYEALNYEEFYTLIDQAASNDPYWKAIQERLDQEVSPMMVPDYLTFTRICRETLKEGDMLSTGTESWNPKTYARFAPTSSSTTPASHIPSTEFIDIEISELKQFNLPDFIIYHLDAGHMGEADHPSRDGWREFLMPASLHTLGYGHLRIKNFSLDRSINNDQRLQAIRQEIYENRMDLNYNYSDCRRYLPQLEKVVEFIAQKMGVSYKPFPVNEAPHYNLAIPIAQLAHVDYAQTIWGVDVIDNGVFEIRLTPQAVGKLLYTSGIEWEEVTPDSQKIVYLKVNRSSLGAVTRVPTISRAEGSLPKPILKLESQEGSITLSDYQSHLSDSEPLPASITSIASASEALFVVGMLLAPIASRGRVSNAVTRGMIARYEARVFDPPKSMLRPLYPQAFLESISQRPTPPPRTPTPPYPSNPSSPMMMQEGSPTANGAGGLQTNARSQLKLIPVTPNNLPPPLPAVASDRNSTRPLYDYGVGGASSTRASSLPPSPAIPPLVDTVLYGAGAAHKANILPGADDSQEMDLPAAIKELIEAPGFFTEEYDLPGRPVREADDRGPMGDQPTITPEIIIDEIQNDPELSNEFTRLWREWEQYKNEKNFSKASKVYGELVDLLGIAKGRVVQKEGMVAAGDPPDKPPKPAAAAADTGLALRPVATASAQELQTELRALIVQEFGGISTRNSPYVQMDEYWRTIGVDANTGHLVTEKNPGTGQIIEVKILVAAAGNRIILDPGFRAELEAGLPQMEGPLRDIAANILSLDSIPIVPASEGDTARTRLLEDGRVEEKIILIPPELTNANKEKLPGLTGSNQSVTIMINYTNKAMGMGNARIVRLYFALDGTITGGDMQMVNTARGTVYHGGIGNSPNYVDVVVMGRNTLMAYNDLSHLSPKQTAAFLSLYNHPEIAQARHLEKTEHPYLAQMVMGTGIGPLANGLNKVFERTLDHYMDLGKSTPTVLEIPLYRTPDGLKTYVPSYSDSHDQAITDCPLVGTVRMTFNPTEQNRLRRKLPIMEYEWVGESSLSPDETRAVHDFLAWSQNEIFGRASTDPVDGIPALEIYPLFGNKAMAMVSGSDELVIGKSEDSDLVVKSWQVSHRQAVIRRKDDHWVITNEGENPIFINGQAIPQGASGRLVLRDNLQIGDRPYQIDERRIEAPADHAFQPATGQTSSGPSENPHALLAQAQALIASWQGNPANYTLENIHAAREALARAREGFEAAGDIANVGMVDALLAQAPFSLRGGAPDKPDKISTVEYVVIDHNSPRSLQDEFPKGRGIYVHDDAGGTHWVKVEGWGADPNRPGRGLIYTEIPGKPFDPYMPQGVPSEKRYSLWDPEEIRAWQDQAKQDIASDAIVPPLPPPSKVLLAEEFPEGKKMYVEFFGKRVIAEVWYINDDGTIHMGIMPHRPEDTFDTGDFTPEDLRRWNPPDPTGVE